MISRILSRLLEQVGFESLTDLLNSVFGIKLKLYGIYLYGVTASAVILGLEEITETYIYDPPLGILILVILTFGDMVLGVSFAIESKNGIEPKKLSRAMIRLLVQCFFISMGFQMTKAFPEFIYIYMVTMLLLVFILTVFISGFKNARALNLITADQYAVFESVFNLKKLIEKLKSKNNESNH